MSLNAKESLKVQEWIQEYFMLINISQSNGGSNKKAPGRNTPRGFFVIKEFGGDLLSHIVSHAVPSALKSLTSVFGMGTGGTSSL